jgi:hydroxylamine dehydrogenase
MQQFFVGLLVMVGMGMFGAASVPAQQPKDDTPMCVDCHKLITPKIVSDWEMSKHQQNDVGCTECHGYQHTSKDDVAKAGLALPEKCAACHEEQVNQFKTGKHALAWGSMKAMPTLHWQPMAQIEGLKGCGGCHRLGLKTEAEVKDLVAKGSGFGVSSCDTCHTRHLFSADEARSPQACQTCHMGIDHPQWEMYSTSKHGVRYLLKQNKVLPEPSAAPTCQTCHMQAGNHSNHTAWGFLAVRLPMPTDPKWAEDRTTVLEGLGVLDPMGQPTPRLDAVKAVDLARLTQEAWQEERDKMLEICHQCHSINFAKTELEKGDQMIREADRLMAEGIKTVADLYKEGVLKKPDSYAYAFPDLLTFHDAPTPIEQKLFIMYLEHRMRTFQGAFHCNPDYSLWYGWSAMQRDLTEIKYGAETMRTMQGMKAKAKKK